MPVVRPIGKFGPLGLVLPTAPQGNFPDQLGNTTGSTNGATSGTTNPASALAGVCAAAEQAGAGGLWAVDHLFWPRPMLECLTALGVALSATDRVLIGSCVLQLPLRNPPALAKATASLQTLSGGRFVLGVGVGSHRGEYDAAGVDFGSRGRLLDEGLAELRRIWDEEPGPGLYRQSPQPAPIQIWVGGASKVALRRAARADGWVPLFVSPDDYRVALKHLGEECRLAGRPSTEVTQAVVVMVSPGRQPAVARREGMEWLSSLYGIPGRAFERHLVAGTAESCASDLARYFDAGAQHVVVMITRDEPVEAFAEIHHALSRRVPDLRSPASLRPALQEVPT